MAKLPSYDQRGKFVGYREVATSGRGEELYDSLGKSIGFESIPDNSGGYLVLGLLGLFIVASYIILPFMPIAMADKVQKIYRSNEKPNLSLLIWWIMLSLFFQAAALYLFHMRIEYFGPSGSMFAGIGLLAYLAIICIPLLAVAFRRGSITLAMGGLTSLALWGFMPILSPILASMG